MRSKKYTEEEIKIIERFAETWPCGDVVYIINQVCKTDRTKKAIEQKKHQLGITQKNNECMTKGKLPKKWTKAVSQLIKEKTTEKGSSRKIDLPEYRSIDDHLVDLMGSTRKIVRVPESKVGPVTATALMSDFQYGRIVENLEGEAIYTPKVADKRIEGYFSRMSDFAKKLGTDRVALFFLGDMTDGELIYANHQTELALYLGDQIYKLHDILWNGIKWLAERFTVDIYCVDGNHGRISKGHSEKSNSDLFLYYTLSRLIAERTDLPINIQVAANKVLNCELHGKRISARHIGVNQCGTKAKHDKVMVWQYIHQYDIMFHAHYHAPEISFPIGDKIIIRNGSIMDPGGVWEESIGLHGSWQQVYMSIDKGGVSDINFY